MLKMFVSLLNLTRKYALDREGESPFVIASNGSTDEQTSPLPFISFISIDLRIYDIHFDSGDLNDVPRVGMVLRWKVFVFFLMQIDDVGNFF